MILKLPPLNTLRLFEASGRQLSFKKAAEELHVTPSAVSHGIQTLEDWLGTELFHRGPRHLSLTPAGEQYLSTVRRVLEELSAATQAVPGRKASGTLSISTAPTFASRWLLPRLENFLGQFPDITITIDTSHRQIEFPLDGIDLAIRMAKGPKPGGTWLRLVQEQLIPVCAPALLERHGGVSREAFLASVPLIHVTSVSEDWDNWLSAAGVEIGNRLEGLRFDTVHMALQAAGQGLGVVLGRKPLVDADLADRRLVPVGWEPMTASTCYWLVGSELTFERPEAKLFRKWLIGELDRPE